MLWVADGSFAILFGKEGIHLRHRAERLNHCVTDDVSEGNFSAAGSF